MLTIGQVAARAGLRASAIRYYEQLGLVPKAMRLDGRRVYDESIFARLDLIDLAKTAGFELRDIHHLLSAVTNPAAKWRALGQAKRDELDRQMKKLKLMKRILSELDGCGCATLAECAQVFKAEKAKYRG